MTADETPFNFDEVFFSRTDHKGLIQSGNEVFRRISGYEWNELIGRPHNVVRHHHMPRGVFSLFWKILNTNSPIAAYVKNQSKDGRFYWVFALAIPVANGYVSIRMKPGSDLFKVVQGEYEKLWSLEKSKNLSPTESCEALEKRLAELGFPDYNSFMMTALTAEWNFRRDTLQREETSELLDLRQIIEQTNSLKTKAEELVTAFKEGTFIPLNLSIQATKLNKEGDPITVVATKYGDFINEIQAEFVNFEKTRNVAQVVVQNCQHNLYVAALQAEAILQFKNESSDNPSDLKSEMSQLERLSREAIQKSIESLFEIQQEFNQYSNVCANLKTVAAGLEIVRLTGKIEVARLSTNREQLDQLIHELFVFKNKLDSAIQEITQLGIKVQEIARNIFSTLSIKVS